MAERAGRSNAFKSHADRGAFRGADPDREHACLGFVLQQDHLAFCVGAGIGPHALNRQFDQGIVHGTLCLRTLARGKKKSTYPIAIGL